MRGSFLAAGIVAGTLGVLATLSYSLGPAPASAAPDVASSGRTPAVAATAEDHGFVGVVVPHEAVDLAARGDGVITAVRVRIGDHVTRGDVLATLDDAPSRGELAVVRARVRAAMAEAAEARLAADDARDRRDRREGASASARLGLSEEALIEARLQARQTRQRLAAAEARVAEQGARVAQLARGLDETVVRAPFDGTVASCFVAPGAAVARGAPLVRLVGADALRVRFALPEEQRGALWPGAVVAVAVRGVGAPLRAVVERVAPEVDAAARVVIAEGRLEVPPALAAVGLAGRAARVRPFRDPSPTAPPAGATP